MWTNTTSSARPHRPADALPSSPAKPLPVYVRSSTQPPWRAAQAMASSPASRRDCVVVAEPAVVELDVGRVDHAGRLGRFEAEQLERLGREVGDLGVAGDHALGDPDRQDGRGAG